MANLGTGENITMDLVETLATKQNAWKVNELAELFSCTPQSLYDLVGKGGIPYFRVGGAIRFDPVAVSRWVQNKGVLEGKRGASRKPWGMKTT